MEEITQLFKANLIQFRTETFLPAFFVLGIFLFITRALANKLTTIEKELTLYMGLGVLMMNPVFILLYEKNIADSSHFMQLLWAFPFSVFLPMIVTMVLEMIPKQKDRIVLGIGLLVLLLLSGSPLFLQKMEARQPYQNGISPEIQQALDIMLEQKAESGQELQPVSLLAVDDVMVMARNYNAAFVLPYGRDILDGTISHYIHDFNTDEMQSLHEQMLHYEEEYQAIFEQAKELEIEFIVLKDRVQKTSGNWYIDETLGKIILTDEFIEQLSLEYQANAIVTGLSYGYIQVEEEGPYLIFRRTQ